MHVCIMYYYDVSKNAMIFSSHLEKGISSPHFSVRPSVHQPVFRTSLRYSIEYVLESTQLVGIQLE